MKPEKRIAKVICDVGGYYWYSENHPLSGMRKNSYPTKAEAQKAAREAGYTHGKGSGMYQSGVRKL